MTEQEIFVEAISRPDKAERLRFLDQACGGDEALRARLEKLLRRSNVLGSFLELPPEPLRVDASASTETEVIGTQIGPYQICEQIGEGGMGVVFMAEQTHPVRRRVALKIIKPGMDTREVIARFEAERQALAMMDHPNIAKVHEAGATDNCRPYFVMELVQGVPITEYCDQCSLTTRERLELFVTVCQAIQHAHQRGVIHRDIKPTNVLVAMQDGQPTAKIIDFGVAKAIGEPLTEHTLTTSFAKMIGSPLYMSPEQAELSPLGVDTRSDIYSLGVLLYELLAGTTPLDKDRLHTSSYDEMRRIIREEEPPRPSARISTLAADLATTVAEHRRTDTRHLRQQVRGELDWIVMKCLEKDRIRRYETPNSLARDIERYLHDEPVQACPPSAAYRLKKFARRNRMALVFVTLLAAGAFFLAYSNITIQRERESKTMAMARARAVTDLFQVMLSPPERGGRVMGTQYTVRELLDDYSDSVGNRLAGQPEAEAEIRVTIGLTYFYLGLYDRAEPHLKRLVELRRQIDGPRHENVADSLARYGHNLFAQRRLGEAESTLLEALEMYRQLGIRNSGPIHAMAILQEVLALSGRHDEAQHVIEQAWAAMQMYEKLTPEFRTYVNYYCNAFACYFARIGRPERAAEFAQRSALAAERAQNTSEFASALTGLAIVQLRLGDETGYRKTCAKLLQLAPRIEDEEAKLNCIRIPNLGPDAVKDPNLLVKLAEEFSAKNSLRNPDIDLRVLGAAHFRAGNYKQAAEYFEQSIAQSPSDATPGQDSDLGAQVLLAMTKWQRGDHDEARRMLGELQPRIEKSLQSPWVYWDRRAVLEIRRREAEALIQPLHR